MQSGVEIRPRVCVCVCVPSLSLSLSHLRILSPVRKVYLCQRRDCVGYRFQGNRGANGPSCCDGDDAYSRERTATLTKGTRNDAFACTRLRTWQYLRDDLVNHGGFHVLVRKGMGASLLRNEEAGPTESKRPSAWLRADRTCIYARICACVYLGICVYTLTLGRRRCQTDLLQQHALPDSDV